MLMRTPRRAFLPIVDALCARITPSDPGVAGISIYTPSQDPNAPVGIPPVNYAGGSDGEGDDDGSGGDWIYPNPILSGNFTPDPGPNYGVDLE